MSTVVYIIINQKHNGMSRLQNMLSVRPTVRKFLPPKLLNESDIT
jgi:hypothetical protein